VKQPDLSEHDWRERRAEYLARAGRLAELQAEGLERFAPRDDLRRWRDRQRLQLRRDDRQPPLGARA
jgi:hypothetical protein